MIDVYKIIDRTEAEGPYTRFCIWTQGCKKHCVGCWAKETWEFGIGKKYSVDELYEKIYSLKDYIDGVTFLGGEPFEQAYEIGLLAQKVKNIGLSVVTFSGYTYEELQLKADNGTMLLLKNTDLLIDGGFEAEHFDISRPWIGSSNQKYIFLTDRFAPDIISKFKNKVEVRISENGELTMNGMGDFEYLKEKFCLQLGSDKV